MTERVTDEELANYRAWLDEIDRLTTMECKRLRSEKRDLLDRIDQLTRRGESDEKLILSQYKVIGDLTERPDKQDDAEKQIGDFENRIRELESEVELLQSSVKLLIVHGARNEKGNDQ